MSRGAALTGALLVTLATPATWPLALAAFLVRGGLLVVALPILVLPTPVGLGNILAPTLTAAVFGGASVGLIVVLAAIVLVGLAWLIAGGLLAASLEAEAARIMAVPTGVEPPPTAHPQRGKAGRILIARLIADLPLAVALAWGSVRLVAIAYRELTSPFDVATPIVWRVLRSAPEVVTAIVLTWMIGEVVGAIAARRIALGSRGSIGALGEALSIVLRRPLAVLADFWLPTLALVVAIAPVTIAAVAASEVVRSAVSVPDHPTGLVLSVVLFVSVWLVGLFLAAVICAWRAAVWTIGFGEAPR